MMSLDSTFISDHPPPPPREWEPDQMRSRAPVMVLEEMIFGSLPLMTQRRQSRAVRVLEEDKTERNNQWIISSLPQARVMRRR